MKDFYIHMTNRVASNRSLVRALHVTNQIVSWLVALAYPALLIYDLIAKSPVDIYGAIVVPLDGFLILSVIRMRINRKRPYESLSIEPAIPKSTKGNSFPSRHVFSAMMIAVTFLWYSPFLAVGIVLTVFAVGLAVIRVLTGVHYISDVLAGMCFALIIGAAGYLYLLG